MPSLPGDTIKALSSVGVVTGPMSNACLLIGLIYLAYTLLLHIPM